MLFYRYQPLQHHDSIRILVLHPSVQDTEPITCSIRHGRLFDASLEYEAVSYTWGNTTQQRAIYFRDRKRELIVGENCHCALQRLRLGHKDRLLWLDAICINQENITERASQVRIMDSIYSHAFRVVVFLGEQDTDSLALFKELAAADELLRIGNVRNRPLPSDAVVKELETLFERPWFKRVWVLQEVCAKRSVQMMCGSASASFEALEQLYYGYRGGIVTKRLWPLALNWIKTPPEEISTPQINLWNRLYHSRDCLATDPRDRVFALKSLIGLEQRRMDYLVNYAQSIEDCFIQVAHFLLPVLGLKLLTAVRHPHNMDMPSWIPDWSQNLPLSYHHFESGSDPESPNQLEPCLETRSDRKVTIRWCGTDEASKPRLELLVTGCQYARIVERSQVFHFSNLADAERQMKGLYSTLGNLQQFVVAEGMCVDASISDILGQTILDGRH
jgi:hypothetical protein